MLVGSQNNCKNQSFFINMGKSENKEIAKTLFIEVGLSQAEIAKRLKLSKQVISKWVNDENWNVLKGSKTASPSQIIQRTFHQIARIYDEAEKEDRKVTSGESDQISKLMAGIKFIKKEADLSSYIQAYEEFLIYLRQEDAELAKDIADYQMDFLTLKARELSQPK